jgi:N-acetylmuramoyl-L-alanine amidase
MAIFRTLLLTCVLAMGFSVTAWAHEKGEVTANKVNVRDNGCINDSNILFRVNKGEPILIKGVMGDYYLADIQKHEDVYIAIEFVRIVDENAWQNENESIDEIIDYAKTFLGVKYIFGSQNPGKGFDCSGYIQYVFKHFDITVSRNSAAMVGNGHDVSKADLAKGDLVFFATGKGTRITHVGMYIGGGQFIHASSWRGGVVIDDVHNGYYGQKYVKAVRVL